MKKSHKVVLWMLGAGLGVALLSEEQTTERLKQDQYANREDCVTDWGAEARCTPDETSGSAHGGSGGYHGPRYYWDRTAGHPVIVNDAGVHQALPGAHPNGDPLSHSSFSVDAGHVTRGGFGHLGGHSGGG
jgi:uncharacterized protein YgiB involved in biofilm formation